MKKRIFKQKKLKSNYHMDYRNVIYRNTRHRAGKAARVLVVLSLLAGVVLPARAHESETPAADTPERAAAVTEVSAAEVTAPKVVVTEIFHRHVGDASKEGGCYRLPIAHVHKGDEQSGGACFQGEVKHVHTGDEVSGTGCYTRPVLHIHDGNEGQEGACYHAVYHTHENSCYDNEICTIQYTKKDVFETFMDECEIHGETTFERANGTGTHKDCETGVEDLILEYCQACGPMTYNYHTYPVLVCGIDTDQIVRYEKICGREEGDIEGYETSCNMTEGQTESYQLTCVKKVDGYDRNCGLDEVTPCGRLTVTNETVGQDETVMVSVKFEDLSGGRLVPCENPFQWYDEAGKEIGNGNQITVRKNGNYTVELKLQNRDVDEDGLKSSILVDNVLEKTAGGEEITPSPSLSPSASPEKEGNTSASPERTPEDSGDHNDGHDDEDDGSGDDPVPTPSAPLKSAVISGGEGGSDENNKKDTVSRDQSAALPKTDTMDKGEGPSLAANLKKETVERKAEEKMESAPSLPEKKEVSRLKGFFSIPAVRMITVAAGTLLFLTGLFLLLLYLRKSVRLYNDDGEGGFIYLGRLAVRLEEEGYAVTISEKAVEGAYTNRYCIKPGLFRLGKGELSLFVYQNEKKVSVCLSKEIIVVF